MGEDRIWRGETELMQKLDDAGLAMLLAGAFNHGLRLAAWALMPIDLSSAKRRSPLVTRASC
jgi:hypothetical protein